MARDLVKTEKFDETERRYRLNESLSPLTG